MQIKKIHQRLCTTKNEQIKQSEIALALTCSREHISRLFKVDKELKPEQIQKIEQYFNINLSDITDNECINIPLIEASAGGGCQSETSKMAFPLIKLNELGYNKNFDRLAFANIRGDSMYPDIKNGDMVIIDKTVETLSDGAIYVLNYNGDLFCKKILKGAKYIILKSQNPEYPPEKIEGDELKSLKIIGKVIFLMRNTQN